MSTSKKKFVVGIMGPGKTATLFEKNSAYRMGNLIGLQDNWILLTGGSNYGVMNEALRGAKEKNPNCTTMGILSCRTDETEKISEYADIKIGTGQGEGRNNLNITTSDYVVFCCDKIKDSLGTFSELIFALKHKKPFVFLVTPDITTDQIQYYKNILLEFAGWRLDFDFSDIITDSPEHVVKLIQQKYQTIDI